MNHQSIEIAYDLSDSNSEAFNEIEIGNINLPTGKIIAADPTHDVAPFSRTVTPGQYPVKLCVHEIAPDKYIVEYAKIKFRPEKASKWILAVRDDMDLEKLSALEEGGFFGYSVGDFSCFLDEATQKVYSEKEQAFFMDSGKTYFNHYILPKLTKKIPDAEELEKQVRWSDHKFDDTDNNMMLFPSGWGYGYYPTYWGYNDKNETVELTIDFLILDTYWNHHDLP